MTEADARIFFVHVMKTGGASFRRRIEANVGVEHVYPWAQIDQNLLQANMSLDYLQHLPEERLRSIRAFTGHFPFLATQLLPGPFVTLTILRDPVERTISYLKHCRRLQARHRDMALEEIYEDPTTGPLVANHQAKVFSLTAEDEPGSIRKRVEVDDAKLKQACANLEEIDLIGLQEHYDEFVAAANTRFGWTVDDTDDWHISRPEEIAPSFRARLREDLAVDLAFYDFARDLHHRRQAA